MYPHIEIDQEVKTAFGFMLPAGAVVFVREFYAAHNLQAPKDEKQIQLGLQVWANIEAKTENAEPIKLSPDVLPEALQVEQKDFFRFNADTYLHAALGVVCDVLKDKGIERVSIV